MKKKKGRNLKGFTLIELLAVIVILAIIALIAVPQILKILNKSRKSVAEDSTYGIVKAAENYVTNFMLENNGTLPSESLEFDCDANGCNLKTPLTGYNLTGLDKLDFKGTKPTSGTIRISNNGNNITTTDLVINNFVCGYIGGKISCIKKGEYETKENGTIIYFNPETGKQCNDYVETNSDTENKSGCMKWYVFNDSENNMAYNLLLDHNTTAKIDSWNNRNTQLTSDTTDWDNSLNSRLITANEVAKITGNSSWNSATATFLDWFYFYDFTTENSTGMGNVCANSGCEYGWLYDRAYRDCIGYGCLNNATGDNISGMHGYWTSTNVYGSADNAWRVHTTGRLENIQVSPTSIHGIRPVITVSKSNIL